MKTKLIAWSLWLACTGAQAQVVDLGEIDLQAGAFSATHLVSPEVYGPVAARDDYVPLVFEMSHLPEPAVFLMMLGGLVLLGGIAKRERSDLFTKEE